MIRKARGTSMVEYVVLITLIIGLVGVAALSLIGAIQNRLIHVSNHIGS